MPVVAETHQLANVLWRSAASAANVSFGSACDEPIDDGTPATARLIHKPTFI